LVTLEPIEKQSQKFGLSPSGRVTVLLTDSIGIQKIFSDKFLTRALADVFER
jgi:hypothetical protein